MITVVVQFNLPTNTQREEATERYRSTAHPAFSLSQDWSESITCSMERPARGAVVICSRTVLRPKQSSIKSGGIALERSMVSLPCSTLILQSW
jgi:hypothetical protein